MMLSSGLPDLMDGARVRLRGWEVGDAAALHAVLADNQAHLTGWIPAAISTPESADALVERILAFQSDAMAGLRERRAMHDRATGTLLGGIDLFGRTANGRVPFAEADRLEIGYWIRRDATGGGLVTEAVRTLLLRLPPVAVWKEAVIRCDVRNAASRRVAERLGFLLATRDTMPAAAPADGALELETWAHPLPYLGPPPGPSSR